MSKTEQSLRSRLVLRFGIALALLLLLDGLACYYTALHFANLVYDRWLIDSTRSLARAVRVDAGAVRFNLPPNAIEVFRFDAVDTTYFRISAKHQGTVGGDERLPRLPMAQDAGPQVANAEFLGHPIRLVAWRTTVPGVLDPVEIEVAETLLKRSTLTREILLVMVAPQIALAAFALLLSWLSAARGLKPLTDLADELAARDPHNLAPVSESGRPYEARVLVQRLNDLLGRISHAFDAQQRFVADAAHQIRTPLAAITLHAERAARAVDAEAARAAHQALHAAVQRAARLSKQLLTLARSAPDAAALEAFAPVDLTALTRQVGEGWIAIALERNIDFGLAVPDAPLWVMGNERLLGEMLGNLIDNALCYTPREGTVTVSVQLVTDGQRIEVAIEDNGHGIPANERLRVLERFHRVPGTAGGGAGLGLAIVAAIARAHATTVTIADGALGRGIRVSVSLAASSR